MIKDIYIHIATLASAFPILHFCNTNTAILEKHGYYYPKMRDIAPSYPQELDFYDVSTHEWLVSMQNTFSEQNAKIAEKNGLEPFVLAHRKKCLINLAQKIEAKQNIHSLCLFVNPFLTDVDQVSLLIKEIEETFPHAKLHISILSLLADKEVLGKWLHCSLYENYPLRLEEFILYIQNRGSWLYTPDKIYKNLSENYEEKIARIVIQDEKNFSTSSLCTWLDSVDLSHLKSLVDDKSVSFFISKEKFLFLNSFSKNNYPEKFPLSWLKETDFIQCEISEKENSEYLTKEQKEFINKQYEDIKNNVLMSPIVKYPLLKDTLDNLIDLDLNDALFLASQLSAGLRARLEEEINTSALPFSNLNIRNIHSALLATQKRIEKDTMHNLAIDRAETNIKNIYIFFSPFLSRSIMTDYVLTHKKEIEKHGIYYPICTDLFEHFPKELEYLNHEGNTWLYTDSQKYNKYLSNIADKILNKKFTFPENTDLFTTLVNYLANKKNLHSLAIFAPITTNYSSIVELYKILKIHFPNARIHAKGCDLPQDRKVESLWCEAMMNGECKISLMYYLWYVHHKGTSFNLIKPIQEIFSDGNTSFDYTKISHEKEVIPHWIKWLKLENISIEENKLNTLPSSQVLSFIKAVSNNFYLNSIHYDWISQKEFLSYKTDEGQINTYLRPYWRNYIQEQYKINFGKADILQENIKYKDLSDESLGISFDEAITLAKLLESDFRKLIVTHLDTTLLAYQTQAARNVFAALLYVEDRIDEETLSTFTQNAQGCTLPPQAINGKIDLSEAKVAVLTMTYNHKDYIEQCIKSVLMQETDFPVTHIISDDDSTDGTREILLKYAAKYPHIKLIFNDTNTPHEVAGRLFDQISAPYVALCDGDDYFSDTKKLQKQVDYLEENPRASMCFHFVQTIFEDNPDLTQIYPKEIKRGIKKQYYLRELLIENFIQTNSVMYRWRFQNKALPAWFAFGTCPSDRYWHLIQAEEGFIGFIPEIMSVYRRHSAGHFFHTTNNILKHRDLYGLQEIMLFEFLNIHFEGKFQEELKCMVDSVYAERIYSASKREDITHIQSILAYFPSLQEYLKNKFM